MTRFRRLLTMILAAGSVCGADMAALDPEFVDFWETQKKGANGNMTRVRTDWFDAAADAGFQFIRFNASWFLSDSEDFLIGNADDFTEIEPADLELLTEALDEAHERGLKIVLTMFELPGCRYEREGENPDGRLWREEEFQRQAFSFWKQLAAEMKDHPAIVAYNPLNEPHPERFYGHYAPNRSFRKWLEETEGTPADLNRFNRKMVEAIRSVDPYTPILLDGYFYADPQGLPYMEVIDDPAVLYSFHNPAPWEFAAFRANGGRYRYPDRMPGRIGESGARWSIRTLERLLDPVEEFIEANGLNPRRVVAGEFWCDRRVPGCAVYFDDLLEIYDDRGWHWAFYAFREDMDWTGLDYEMGGDPITDEYWAQAERTDDWETLKPALRHANPIWSVLEDEFR